MIPAALDEVGSECALASPEGKVAMTRQVSASHSALVCGWA